MRTRRLLWWLLLLPLLAAPWAPSGAAPARTAAGPSPAGDGPALVGTPSCAGRACHGAIEPLGDGRVRRNEFTLWVSQDRHADAYRVLETDRSRRIGQLLHLKNEPKDEALCLNCHTYPGILTVPKQMHGQGAAEFVRDFEGVGCETCHGPAERWLGPHALAGWATVPPEEKARLGMAPLATARERAERCVVCHVGTATADMNHDLIAAGHPRLAFEFGQYFANMPKHWAAPKPEPGEEAKAWAVGQLVSARAALELLAYRAGTPGRPWPEFAEYDCYACHHDFQVESWRMKRGYAGGVPGSLVPSTWYLGLPRALAEEMKAPDAADPLDRIAASLRRRPAERAGVAKEAHDAAARLGGLLDRVAALPTDPASLRKRIAGLAADLGKRERTWDEEAQVCLALAALERAHPDAQDRKVQDTVEALYRQLAFPKGQDSPGAHPSAEEVRKALEDLAGMLK